MKQKKPVIVAGEGIPPCPFCGRTRRDTDVHIMGMPSAEVALSQAEGVLHILEEKDDSSNTNR